MTEAHLQREHPKPAEKEKKHKRMMVNVWIEAQRRDDLERQ